MRMLRERAAGFFQGQGWRVVVNPCLIGDSGAIHTPDLHLLRDGEKPRVAFVLDALDGHGPLEQRAHAARDMGLAPVFVVGDPSPEVRAWADRHHHDLLDDAALPPEGPPGAALASLAAPAPRAEAQPLAADDGGAMLLASAPARAAAPAPAAAPPEDDGGAELLVARPRAAPAPPPAPTPAPEAPMGDDGGAELLSGSTRAVHGDKLAKHDLSIWDPRARLAQVKQAAKAQGFETTGGPSQAASPWLQGLRRRA